MQQYHRSYSGGDTDQGAWQKSYDFMTINRMSILHIFNFNTKQSANIWQSKKLTILLQLKPA